MLESPHFVFDSYAGYDNGHKTNDNTPNNYKGHDRFLEDLRATSKARGMRASALAGPSFQRATTPKAEAR